jgi:REP element-mobilizing transposase RayT
MSDKLQYKLYYRRNLPHYQPQGGVFFVTYRLAFSLPKFILDELSNKKRELDKKLKNLSEAEQQARSADFDKILFAIEDHFLDIYSDGPQWLKNDAIAQLVIESLLFHHEKVYDLYCGLIMSNHVHAVLKPRNNWGTPYSLSEIMKNHKSFTATQANKLLNRTGQFWHHENYDHWIRDERELFRVLDYVLNNPVKAGLVENYQDWKHYWLNDELLP